MSFARTSSPRWVGGGRDLATRRRLYEFVEKYNPCSPLHFYPWCDSDLNLQVVPADDSPGHDFDVVGSRVVYTTKDVGVREDHFYKKNV